MSVDPPSPSELVVRPPERIELVWCAWCGKFVTGSPHCGRDAVALAYELVPEGER